MALANWFDWLDWVPRCWTGTSNPVRGVWLRAGLLRDFVHVMYFLGPCPVRFSFFPIFLVPLWLELVLSWALQKATLALAVGSLSFDPFRATTQVAEAPGTLPCSSVVIAIYWPVQCIRTERVASTDTGSLVD